MKLQRKLTQWTECVPEEMVEMSPAAIEYALADAKADILTMAKLLCEAGYPRRGTPEEFQSIYDFAAKVQTLIPHSEAAELSDSRPSFPAGRRPQPVTNHKPKNEN